MESKIDLFEDSKENDKNTINKCKELAELEVSVHHFKMQDRTITNMENISTVHSEISTPGNFSESDLKSTNKTSNTNESHGNINCITNESNIQNSVQEDTTEVSVDCGGEKNDCNLETTINTQKSSGIEFLVHENPINVIDGDNEINDHILWKRKPYKNQKKHIIFDSDSDEDIFPLDKDRKAINLAPIYCIDDKGKMIPETDNRSQSLRICDPESSDDDRSDNHEDYAEPLIETSIKTDIKKPKKSSSNSDKKITGRDVAKLRKEITSESQRMTRECAVNLPYHKPKARTLKEFLQNRPRFATTIPASTSNTPPSIAIKMLSEHLEMISQKLSEREKEVEQFFKSESESEEETEHINIRTEEESEHIKPEISEEIESYSKEVAEREQKEIIEQNEDTFEQNEKINKPRESTVIVLQNILLNSNVPSENARESSQTEQINTQATTEADIYDAESQSQESVIKSNGELENKTRESSSPQYEFTMNDVSSGEEENEDVLNSEADKVNKLIAKYSSTNVSKEIANILVNLEECNKEDMLIRHSKNISQLNLVEMSSIKPELKGSPGLVIDLEDGSTKLSDVNMLMDRFLRHNKKKTPQRNKVKLDIISVSGGEIHKETVEVPTHDEETITINEKPGERLKKLRNELETQMAQRRSQLWLEKSNLKVKSEENDEKKNDAHIECEADNDMLDDEDEGEFTNSEEEEDDDDEQEEDIICVEDNDDEEIDEGETKQKSVFVDEEAEESDLEDDENSVNCDEDLIGDSEPCHSEAVDVNGDETNQQYNNEGKQKKKLKRILKPFSNDSDDEDSSLDNTIDPKIDTFASNTTNAESNKEYVLDSTDTWDDSDPTPYQPRNSCTPSKAQTQSKSELGFLTPVVQLTGLQSLNSGSKFLHESPVSPFVMPIDSPTRSFTHSGPQKRLFPDSDLTTTQEMCEVAELCSGKFPSQTQETNDASKPETISGNTIETSNHTTEKAALSIQDEPSTQDLLELCSGKFTGITQPDKIERNNETNDNDKLPPTESNIGNNNPSFNLTEISISNDEVKNLDNEDKLISQLLDEEEMENFKRKFDSPSNENDSSLTSFPRVIYDSSDDESNLLTKRKPKKQRKLVFSDDESSNSCDQEDMLDEDTEETDYCNNIDEEQALEDDNAPETLEYDSEENEISVNMKEKPKKIKIGDFLENEAELSESEWGSADEDEGGLDELEIEEGDKDQLDENKIKTDLERIHIRRILDDDNQELKVLQELLLDHGELHGSGRARQFRWKNIDSGGNDVDASHQEEGEIYLDDENEDEERWRKMRYEREEFLKKQMEKSQLVNIDESDAVNTNSQVFKLGQKALIRQISNTPNSSVILEKKISAPISEIRAPVSLLCKRGSFLTRSDQVLARVAEFTKTITPVVGGVKKSKNFIFQTVTESTDVISLSNKRKAPEGTPKAIKRLRLNNVSPAIKKNDRKFNKPKGEAV